MPRVKINRSFLVFIISAYCLMPFIYLPIVAAVPFVQEDLQISVFTAAIFVGAFPLGMGISQLYFGSKLDRVAPNKIFLWGFALLPITSILCFISADQVVLLTILHVFAATGVAAILLANRFSLNRLAARRPVRLAKYYTLEKVTFISSAVLVPSLVTLIISNFSWPFIYLFSLTVSGIFAIAFRCFVYHQPLLKARTTTTQPGSFFSLLKNTNFLKNLLLASFTSILLNIYIIGYPFSLKFIFNVSLYLYGFLMTLNLIAAGIGLSLNMVLLKYFSIKKSLYICIVVLAALSPLIVLTLLFWSISLPLFVFIFFVMRAALQVFIVNTMTLTISSSPSNTTGRAAAIYGCINNWCGLSIGLLTGYVLTLPYDDLTSLMVFLALACLLPLVTYHLVNPPAPEETVAPELDTL